MANADRISEVYKGLIWDDAPRQRARGRIDWLVGHARGVVLDVGCSQGIATILAGRATTTVFAVGVDVELDRLDHAMADRVVEPDAVAARTGFVGASGTALPFADDAFDTVLLGEVLEHLTKPDDVLAEVARVVRPTGTVALTVPFGLSPHHDHRRTFYVADLLELVAGHLAVTAVDLVDRYLRVVAAPGDDDPTRRARLLAAVQPAADREILAVERAELAGRGHARELERATHALATRTQQLAAAERTVTRLRRAVERAETRLTGMRRRQEQLVVQRDTYRWQLERLRNRRSVRALVAVRDAVSAPRALVALPARLARIVAGPAPPAPRPPAPTANGAAHGGAADARTLDGAAAGGVTAAQARDGSADAGAADAVLHDQGATDDGGPGRDLRLRMRLLAPRPPVALGDLRVAAVLDEFSESCIAPECDLVTFRPDDWEAVLGMAPPHLLFVESAWRATGGAWQYQVGTYHHASSVGLPHLSALVGWCRRRGIPTVFWNKEDPVHFDRFSQAAQLFDVVLTTDADCVGRYRQLERLRAAAVDALPFAAQPRLHHPVTLDARSPTCAFGGTYYRTRHPERRAQLEMLLDAATDHGLVIFDRTHGTDVDGVGFPERFAPYVRGGLTYERMVTEYRRHRLFLNANSVVASPTMFSRRVFELLASGTPVVSTPSAGMEDMFGDIVVAVDDTDAARGALRRLLDDDTEWQRRSAAGLRRVHGTHTYADRLATVARLAGYDLAPHGDERVAVLLLADGADRSRIDHVLAQTHRPHELLVGADRDVDVPGATVVRQGGGDRARRLADLAGRTDAPWVLVVGADHRPGVDELADLAVARRWTHADVIGSTADGAAPHRYVEHVAPHAVLARRELVAAHGWDDRGDADVQPRLRALGASCYAAR